MAEPKTLAGGAPSWLRNSLKHSRDEARAAERRLRIAYRSVPLMMAAADALADAHGRAAQAYENALDVLEEVLKQREEKP